MSPILYYYYCSQSDKAAEITFDRLSEDSYIFIKIGHRVKKNDIRQGKDSLCSIILPVNMVVAVKINGKLCVSKQILIALDVDVEIIKVIC